MSDGKARFASELVERLGLFHGARPYLKSTGAARVRAAEAGGDALRRGEQVIGPGPLHELRPKETPRLEGGGRSVTAEEADLMRASHAEVSAILDAARGRRLTEADVRRLVALVNPTKAPSNCVEGSLALDDILGGTAKVAGPTVPMETMEALALLGERAIYPLRGLNAAEIGQVESQLTSFGPGARGIIHRFGLGLDPVPNHTYNVMNVNGRILYLEGQVAKVFPKHPARGAFSSYDFFRTG